MITIVSLGVEKGDWSARAQAAIRSAELVLVRTALTVSAQVLREEGISFESLDCVYEKSRNFETLKKNLVAEVLRRAEGKNVCYCVDGGVHEDGCAQILLRKKGVTVIEGVSKGAYAAAMANLGGTVQSVSAYAVGEEKLTLPLVVYDVDSRDLAGDIKLLLCDKFGDEAPAFFIHGGKGRKIALYEADRAQAYDYSTMIAIYSQPLLEKQRYDIEDLMTVLRRLRAPDGCPWDRVQTHESIRLNMIEEAYELVDAIDAQDEDKICEEAGDVVMQAAFHTLIEEERGTFTLTDVLTMLCEKLITRHTHVFGDDQATGEEGALSVWDKNKMTEKGQATYSDSVNDVPECFPALLRAQKIAKRVEKGGWDKDTFEGAVEQLNGELEELRAAHLAGDSAGVLEELGDVLMCICRMGRAVGAECEQALLDAAHKIQKRYTAYEKLVLADGKDVLSLTQEERDYYYCEAKKRC